MQNFWEKRECNSRSAWQEYKRSGGIIITEEKICTVRSLDLANYLCNRGFKMKKVIDSDKNPQFKVFIFKDSDAIQNSITTYLLKKGV